MMTSQPDSAVQTLSGFSGTTIGGHSHIEGKTAAVIRDNIVDASSVVSSGNITTARHTNKLW